jgi:hypothetical protein
MGQPAHSSLPCPLSWKRSRCCAKLVWEISSVYVADKLGRSPPHFFMYLVLSSTKGENKQKRDSTGSRIREPLFKFKYKFTMRPSSNNFDMIWLTFPCESILMTCPIWIRNSYKDLSAYKTNIYVSINYKVHLSNLTPCLVWLMKIVLT